MKRAILLAGLALLPLPAALGLDPAEERLGFSALSDGKTFHGWKHPGNWEMQDGAFARVRSGGQLTFEKHLIPDDFELRFEWKASKGCNSGVYYRPGQVEYQVLDDANSPYGENPRQSAASLFFCMAPARRVARPAGEWNTARILCKGSVIEHWLNEQRVISFDYTDPRWAREVELLRIRGGDLTGRGGKLLLQDHGQDVSFRNLRLRSIPAAETLVPDPTFQPLPVTGAALEKENARVRSMLEKARVCWKEDFSAAEKVFDAWVPYGRLADGTWAQGAGKARPEWWALEEGALRGHNFPEEKHPAGISLRQHLPQARLAETGARLSWRIKFTETSRGTLRLFGLTPSPHQKDITDNHVLALDVSAAGLRLWNGNRELTGPAPNKAASKYRNTVLEQKSPAGAKPGIWHALVLEVLGREARAFLNGRQVVTLKTPHPQPLRSLSLEADGDKKSPGRVWFDDIIVEFLPTSP